MRPAIPLVALVASACAGRYPTPPYAPQTTAALEAIPLEPPPARAERVPARPNGATVWLDGEWTWRRHRWAWVPGRWVTPAAGMRYVPWCTVRAPDGTLYFAASEWRDGAGRPVEPPTPLAVAGVESGEVVDPAGDSERTTVVPP